VLLSARSDQENNQEMPTASQGIEVRRPGNADNNKQISTVTCPFCGLHCDDLSIDATGGRVLVTRNGCARAKDGFERLRPDVRPQINGRDVDLDAAIAEAARLIRGSRLPLYGGLATDVEGMRALLSLADKSGGIVDHPLSPALYRNMGVMQTRGWFMSTLTETRNRADLVIVVGSDLMNQHPRFFERVVAPPETMFGEGRPRRGVVLIGETGDIAAIKSQGVENIEHLACPNEALPSVLGTLRAIMKERPLQENVASPVPAEKLQALAERCKAADYGVVVWAPQSLSFADADLAVELITDIMRDLNKETRFAGLSLGGNDGAASAASVCSWQSGYPLRVSFASGAPIYDPHRFDISRMLAQGEGDLLVWTASIDHRSAPPASDLPLILLGTPGIEAKRTPAVFIPVATPGIDQEGRLIRCDSVVSLPVHAIIASRLAAVPELAQAIQSAL